MDGTGKGKATRPAWLRTRLPGGEGYAHVRGLIREHGLNTVCDEARCPNKGECWSSGTATFLLMGDVCTRSCRFCSVRTAEGPIPPPDPDEARRVAEAARLLRLRHVVLTSVTRDDLPDGGAAHMKSVVTSVHEALPEATVEALVPALDEDALRSLLEAGIDVLAHNVEVTRRLTPIVRDPRADYDASLDVLRAARKANPGTSTKSSLLLGLGETHGEVLEALDDLRDAGVDLVALGQYLQPTRRHAPVMEYVTPDRWDEIRDEAVRRGFRYVAAGPFIRTSFRAHEALATVPEIPYRDGLALQERARAELAERGIESLVVLTHPAVITLGRQADESLVVTPRERLERAGIEVVRTTRGGEVTYHGPGQLVVYPVVDLARRGMRGRAYVALLVDALVETLRGFGIQAFPVEGVIGVFARAAGSAPAKIAAVGVSISRGITGHGVSLNVSTDLEAYRHIVPCGLRDFGVTSMHELVDDPPRLEEVAVRLVSSLRARLGQDTRRIP